jgi:alkylation response protein AidB-like acyl-CoA dehydrogenase
VTSTVGSASRWLLPLLPGVPEVAELDARRISRFEDTLGDLLTRHPIGPGVEPRLRSQRLAQIRRELAVGGHLGLAVPARDGGCGGSAVSQALMQFICGYHDADLRDATGLGHGRLIARHASTPVRDRWLPRLLAGDLPGIAITEPHGGSQVHATSTAATAHHDGTWTVTGTKTWISRLNEAAMFTIFFKDPAGRLTAGVIDAVDGGLDRHPILPCGLSGWAWGELRLKDVRLRPATFSAAQAKACCYCVSTSRTTDRWWRRPRWGWPPPCTI